MEPAGRRRRDRRAPSAGTSRSASPANAPSGRASSDFTPQTPTTRDRESARAVPTAAVQAQTQPPLPPTPPPDAKTGDVKILGRRHRERGGGGRGAGRGTSPGAVARAPVAVPVASDHSVSPTHGAHVPSHVPSPMSLDSPSARAAQGREVIDLSAEMYEDEQPYVEILHIPNNKVGLVIGRDGRHVGFVQNRTGTRISIARDSWDGSRRRVEIEGPPERCREAATMIQRLIASADDRDREISEGAIRALFEGLEVAETAVMAANVVASQRAREELADDADAQFDDSSADFDGRGMPGAPRGAPPSARQGPATATMTIPHTKVGMIIGRGGDNVKYIQQQTHARIQIQTDAETPEGAPNRMVYLRGPVEACRHAARLINDMCIGRVLIHAPVPHHGALMTPAMPGEPLDRGDRGAGKAVASGGGGAPPYPSSRSAYGPMQIDYSAIPAMYPPPYFGQPYTGLYNVGAYPHEMMPYWNQYATYYGQPPMMTPYDLGGKEGQTVYYEQPATPPFRYGEEIERGQGESEGEVEVEGEGVAEPQPRADSPSSPESKDAVSDSTRSPTTPKQHRQQT